MTNESSAFAFLQQATENLLIKNYGEIPSDQSVAKNFMAQNVSEIIKETTRLQWECLVKIQNSPEAKKILADKVYDTLKN